MFLVFRHYIRAGFLNPRTIDISGKINVCCGGLFGSIPGLYSLDFSSNCLLPGDDNQK